MSIHQHHDTPSPTRFVLFYVVPLVAVAVIVGFTLFLRDNPLREIERRLESMAEEISGPAPEGLVATARSAQNLLDFFTTEATIEAGRPFAIFNSRREFVTTFLALRREIQDFHVLLKNPEISLGSDHKSAAARVTATATGRHHGDRFTEVREFQLQLTKEDGRWRLSKIQLVDVIVAPQL